jgi:trimeric autotransporter adhesin
MPLNFPATPSNGQIYTDATSGNRYMYISAYNYWSYLAANLAGSAANSNVLFLDNGFANGASGVNYHKANLTLITSNAIVNGTLTISRVSANGTLGTSSQVLTSNGTTVYWTSPAPTGVTNIATGNGVLGGPITSTGTIYIHANTGIVSNTTGLFVNAAYIATVSANNTTYVNGKLESGLNVNSATSATTATNATQLGGVAAASYVQNTDSRTLSGNLVFSGANSVFSGNATFNAGIRANSSFGNAGQVLTTNGSVVYWANSAASGGGLYKGGGVIVGEVGNANNIFRINGTTLNFNTTISAGENAQATGPITVAPGVTLTVESGARVSIV